MNSFVNLTLATRCFFFTLTAPASCILAPSLFARSPAAQPRLPPHPHPQHGPGAPGEGGAGRARLQAAAGVLLHREGHQVPCHATRLHGEAVRMDEA